MKLSSGSLTNFLEGQICKCGYMAVHLVMEYCLSKVVLTLITSEML